MDELGSSLNQTQEEATEQVKGFISKIRQMIQDKVKYILRLRTNIENILSQTCTHAQIRVLLLGK